MGILSTLFGNYADDIARKAAASYGDDVLRNAAKTAARQSATNYSDDVAKAAMKSAKQTAKATTKAGKSTAAQQIAKVDFDDYLTSLGADKTLRKNMAKSTYNGVLGKKPMVDRFKTLNVDLANVADKSAAGINAYGGIMNDLFDYMDNANVGIDLSSLKTSGNIFSKAQKTRLKQLYDVDIDDLLKSKVTAKQANDLYKMTRDLGRRLAQNNDSTQSILAEPMRKLSGQIRDKLDDTASTVSKSFGLKKRLVDAANSLGDIEVARAYAGMADDAVMASMARADMAPYMQMEDFIGLQAPKGDTLKVLGMDLGVDNPMPKAAKAVQKGVLKAKDVLGSDKGKLALVAGGAGGIGLLGGLLAGGNGGGNDGGYSPYASGSTLNALTGGSDVAYGGNGMNAALGGQTGVMGGYNAATEPTLNGYTYDDLENAYMSALFAGDTDAAKAIVGMIDMLDAKTERLKANTTDTGIAQKQQAAMDILNTLMGNFEAQGPVGGTFTNILNNLTGGNYNYQAANYNEQAQGSLSMVIKALGDTGTLAEGDVQRAMGLIPQITDSKEKAYDKYQKLMQILQSAGKAGK